MADRGAGQYTGGVQSVANHLRRERLMTDLSRTALERVDLALELGDTDAELYASRHAIPRVQASRLLQRNRQHGRRRSACHESLFG
jgi:hypothetical protein